MTRGIYVKQNGAWQPTQVPSVNESGTWSTIQAGYVNQGGVWSQFWPPDPIPANILVVGGGGGGGGPSGYEGGGGGGAGGVVVAPSQELSSQSSYILTVGAGGTPDQNGSNSSFGPVTVWNDSVNQTIYPAPYPVYTGFLNTYGVWNYNPPSAAPAGSIELTYTTYLTNGGTYTLTASADNHVNSITFNGGPNVLSEDEWWTSASTTVSLPVGLTSIAIVATNDGGPASVAATLQDASGNIVWSTLSPLNGQAESTGTIAFGGGAGGGGAGLPSGGNGQHGGSGGGGTGFDYSQGGGSGTSGQGNSGGTGYWQGTGAAGGGGGGGYAGPGAPSNGNQGGAGGNGSAFYLGGSPIYVGGGGGGGYGNQGPGGAGPGGAGGSGGGGAGNGGNGVNGTGGGGGGCEHEGATAGGNGGSGGVYIEYVSQINAPLFTGGTITQTTNSAGLSVILHSFITPGTYALTGIFYNSNDLPL